nr:hypothetical protein [uncultured Ottowia sp.]
MQNLFAIRPWCKSAASGARLAAVAATAATARFQGDIQTFAVQKTTNRFSKPANRMVIGFKRQQAARFYN